MRKGTRQRLVKCETGRRRGKSIWIHSCLNEFKPLFVRWHPLHPLGHLEMSSSMFRHTMQKNKNNEICVLIVVQCGRHMWKGICSYEVFGLGAFVFCQFSFFFAQRSAHEEALWRSWMFVVPQATTYLIAPKCLFGHVLSSREHAFLVQNPYSVLMCSKILHIAWGTHLTGGLCVGKE